VGKVFLVLASGKNHNLLVLVGQLLADWRPVVNDELLYVSPSSYLVPYRWTGRRTYLLGGCNSYSADSVSRLKQAAIRWVGATVCPSVPTPKSNFIVSKQETNFPWSRRK